MTKQQIIDQINTYRTAIEQLTDSDVNIAFAVAMLAAAE